MRNSGLDAVQAGIKISKRNINNIRYADKQVSKWKLLNCVQLFVTPWTIQSMEFSRPE